MKKVCKNRRKLGKEKVRQHTNRYRRKTIAEIEMVDKEGRRENSIREINIQIEKKYENRSRNIKILMPCPAPRCPSYLCLDGRTHCHEKVKRRRNKPQT